MNILLTNEKMLKNTLRMYDSISDDSRSKLMKKKYNPKNLAQMNIEINHIMDKLTYLNFYFMISDIMKEIDAYYLVRYMYQANHRYNPSRYRFNRSTTDTRIIKPMAYDITDFIETYLYLKSDEFYKHHIEHDGKIFLDNDGWHGREPIRNKITKSKFNKFIKEINFSSQFIHIHREKISKDVFEIVSLGDCDYTDHIINTNFFVYNLSLFVCTYLLILIGTIYQDDDNGIRRSLKKLRFCFQDIKVRIYEPQKTNFCCRSADPNKYIDFIDHCLLKIMSFEWVKNENFMDSFSNVKNINKQLLFNIMIKGDSE